MQRKKTKPDTCRLLSDSPFAALHFNNLSTPDDVKNKQYDIGPTGQLNLVFFVLLHDNQYDHLIGDLMFNGISVSYSSSTGLQRECTSNDFCVHWQVMMAYWTVPLTWTMTMSLWSPFCSHLYKKGRMTLIYHLLLFSAMDFPLNISK